MIWFGDSSKAKKRQRSFRSQAALAKHAAMLVLPVPAVPDTSILLPLKNPLPSSILSRDGIPDDMRSVETSFSRISEVTGSTEMPSSSIMKGYSLVPCTEPRYLIILKRRVEI